MGRAKAAAQPEAKAAAKAKAASGEESVVLAKDFSNFVTQMKALQESDPFYHAKAALYKDYQALSLRDPKKTDLARRYFSDKSCVWVNSHTESVTEDDTVKQQRKVGYGAECFH